MSALDNVLNFFRGVKTTPEVDNTKQLPGIRDSLNRDTHANALVETSKAHQESARKQKEAADSYDTSEPQISGVRKGMSLDEYNRDRVQENRNYTYANALGGMQSMPGSATADIRNYMTGQVNQNVNDQNPFLKSVRARFQDDGIRLGASPVGVTPDPIKEQYEDIFEKERKELWPKGPDDRVVGDYTLDKDSNYEKSKEGGKNFDPWNHADIITEIFGKVTDPIQNYVQGRDLGDSAQLYKDNLVDDGSYGSETANWMTGERYRQYVSSGMQGRPVDEIDPDEIYSKQEEADHYGFVPYIPDAKARDEYEETGGYAGAAGLFSDLANLRKDLTDETVSYDGKNISGNELIRKSGAFQNDYQNSKDVSFVKRNKNGGYDIPDHNDDDIPLTLRIWDTDEQNYAELPEGPGERGLFFGKDQNGAYRKVIKDASGVDIGKDAYIVDFGYNDPNNPSGVDTDSIYIFDNKDQFDEEFQIIPAENDAAVYGYRHARPLELDDGTKIRADKAVELLSDYFNYNGDVPQEVSGSVIDNIDYGPLNIGKNRPSELPAPFVENGDIHDIVPFAVDMALQSFPYFFGPTSAIKTIGDTGTSMLGFRTPGNESITNTSELMPRDTDRSTQVGRNVGSSVMAGTERLWGGLGKSMFNGSPGVSQIIRAVTKEPVEYARPILRWIEDMTGEGTEEIFGNLVEQLQSNGFKNWYANDKEELDENGGAYKDSETPVIDRLANFLKDAPSAWLSGALLGGLMTTPKLAPIMDAQKADMESKNPLDWKMVDIDGNMSPYRLDTEKRLLEKHRIDRLKDMQKDLDGIIEQSSLPGVTYKND